MRRHTVSLLILLSTFATLIGCAEPQPPAEVPAAEAAPAPAPVVAVARLQSRSGLEISGTVSFTQLDESVAIAAHIEGAPPGPHGLHVHEIGDCSAEDFSTAGGHFNPAGVAHGRPGDELHHAGDLGNVQVDPSGMGHFELEADFITVAEGTNSVVGRAVVLHEKADDFVTQPTGAAGSRLACGVITRQQ